jgi:hypothetical protein
MLFQGQAEAAQHSAVAQQERINSEWAQIRTDQTDTASRLGLDQELASIRAALAANGGRASVGNLEVMQDVRDQRERERRITTGNEQRRVYDMRRQSRLSRRSARTARFGGLMRALPSLVEFGEFGGS